MLKKIRNSFRKFKEDVLSKVYYDFLKWLFVLIISTYVLKYLPDGTAIKNFFLKCFTLSVRTSILIALGIMILTVLFVSFVFNKKYKALKRDNFTDELTGLKNHKALKYFLTAKLIEFKNSTKTLSVILIDVDDFKRYNADFGPNNADMILAKLGELLNNDKRITDETFRMHLKGDEFVVVALETSLSNALLAAERKRILIAATNFVVEQQHISLTVSCGVTEYKKATDDYKSIVDRANAAMVEAKKMTGKNTSKTIV